VFLTLPSDAFLDLLDGSPDLRARMENVSRERRGAAHAAGIGS
jgi:hypothetical protein